MQRSLGASRREAYLKDPTISSSGSSAYDGLKLSTRTDLLSNDKLDTKLDRDRDRDRGGAGDSDSTSSITSSKLAATGPMSVEGFVGFANLPNQVYRKSVKRGFEFNLMAVGQSGLGKSTLINSLFLTEVYNGEHVGPSKRIKKTVYVETNTAILKENGVHLKLSIVDTPGFGDAVDNSNCWTPVVDYIDSKFEEYLSNESRVNRGSFSDQRIHCCIYFIAPTGHSLRPLDVEFMKRIHDKVNIIPVVAKADTMTPEECRDFKKTILNEITQHKIRIYEFPEVDDDEDQKYKRLKDRVPFAVVGSNVLTDSKIGSSGKIRSRVYPWGVVEVENLEHNDFLALRNLILRTHMQDLKDVTNNVHYENYRFAKLSGIAQEGKFQTKDGKDPMAQMEAEKKENEKKMKKMEAEMKQVFELKVKEKMQKLKDSELDLQRRAEQMKKQIEQQEKELEERRRTFQVDLKNWEEANRDFEQRRRSLENMASQEKVIDIKEKSKTKKKGLF